MHPNPRIRPSETVRGETLGRYVPASAEHECQQSFPTRDSISGLRPSTLLGKGGIHVAPPHPTCWGSFTFGAADESSGFGCPEVRG